MFGYIVLTASAGIMDREEARRKNVVNCHFESIFTSIAACTGILHRLNAKCFSQEVVITAGFDFTWVSVEEAGPLLKSLMLNRPLISYTGRMCCWLPYLNLHSYILVRF
ncbi:hypothetical protein MRB53_028239 [Persea americana]|uniref:Uncharacterized protein n=1 Tax=Persea americana TaxID=3435 RepID=A0ACC2KEZ2_PERAE|nr:hypothetical protein MRB53_028239 [Persea americana]